MCLNNFVSEQPLQMQVLIFPQDNKYGIKFEIFCPVNQLHFPDPLFMFHDGTLRDEMNFKDMCPMKQKQKSARIAFDQGYGIVVDNQTNEMVETGWYDTSMALADSHLNSQIPRNWEILKLFFIVNNIIIVK